MKKYLAILLALLMVFSMAACSKESKEGDTIYVMGPTPDHGWTAQAGTYAEAKVAEINAAGEYKAVYLPASSGEEQVDQVVITSYSIHYTKLYETYAAAIWYS